MRLTSALAVAVLTIAPACGRNVEPRQPEHVVRVVVRPSTTPQKTPAPVKREEADPPTPARLPKHSPVPGDSVQALVLKEFGGEGPRALGVFRCETGGWRKDVIYGPSTGSAGERGVAQVHPGWWTRWPSRSRPLVQALGFTADDMFNPKKNLKVAHAILRTSGWRAWTCAR